jgi:hypothetical protein
MHLYVNNLTAMLMFVLQVGADESALFEQFCAALKYMSGAYDQEVC